MKFIALKELPQGQQPGETFETTEAMGNVLMLVGAARRPTADESDDITETSTRRRSYRRRDLHAESEA